MKMIKENSHENRRFLIRFVTSYSILLIFVLIMGFFLYQVGIRDAKNNMHIQNKAVLDNAIDNMDTSLSLMNTLVTQISNDTSFRNLVKFESHEAMDFYRTSLDAMDLLTDFLPIESTLPIEEYFIYLPKVDYVISSNMLSKGRLYYQHHKAYDMEHYDEWLAELEKMTNIKSFVNLNYYSRYESSNFLYKIPMYTSFLTGTSSAMVGFEINNTKLKELFSNLDLIKTGFLYVCDDNNNEVFRITAANTPTITTEDIQTIKECMESPDTYFDELMLHGESVVVTSSNSKSQWTFYLVQPSELVFSNLLRYQNTYAAIILLTCVICLLGIIFLSKRNIKPYILINTRLQNSLQESRTLQQELEEQRPIIYNSYMGRILKGMIATTEEADQISNFLGLDSSNCKYTILYACIYQDQLEFNVEETNQNEIDVPKPDYKDILRSYFNEYFGDNIFFYEVEVNAFAIMIPTPTSKTIDECVNHIRDIFIALHNSLIKNHSIWLFGGLGNRNNHIQYIWKSYQQAVQAASYVREGNVFQSYHDIKRDRSSYYYPFEMAQQLTNFITSGNERQIQEIFRLIRRENFEDRSLPITLTKWLLSDIRNTLLKVRFTITSTDENTSRLEAIDMAFQENKTIDLLEEISIRLCTLFEQKVEGNKLIATIQNYIKENYMDPALSLKKISEEFNISESYFSYLFKAETKQNFSEYLELIRMDQAMILLKNTDVNISNMYLEIGYNNANSFRRAFKKVHGVSPKTVRDSLSSHEQS